MGKLMKYDLRAALRLFIPLWIGTLVLGLVNGVTIEMEQSDNRYLNFFTGLFAVLFVLAIFAILIVAAIYVVQRFYQSMLKDEGYLTFTLPVGIDSILWSKALTALILLAGSAVVCVLAFVMMVVRDVAALDLRRVLESLVSEVAWQEILSIMGCFVLMMAAGCLAMLFLVYLSMAVGQLVQKHRMAASVGAYVGINILTSYLANLGLSLFGSDTIAEALNQFQAFDDVPMVCITFLCIAFYSLIEAAIYYFPARYLFKKKLNLE